MLLTPSVGDYDAPRLRRLYEGSSLQVDAHRVRWIAPATGTNSGGSFDVAVGGGSGQAHAVTHVRTRRPSRYEPVIDRYVITDSAGQMLGSLPSGVGHVGSGAPSHQAGWYPPTVVRAAVQEAGLVWADLDFVGDSAGLDRLFPGLVPDLGQVQVVWWLWAFMLTGFGLYSMIWPWQLRHQPASAGYIAFMVLLGAAFVCLGVLAAPVMQRRWRKCAIRQQVTDAAS